MRTASMMTSQELKTRATPKGRAKKPRAKNRPSKLVGSGSSGSLSSSQENLRKELKFLRAGLKAYNDAFDAQPWATDEPARVQLDRITARLAAAEAATELPWD